MPLDIKLVETLSNQLYFFSINVVGFVKSLQKASLQTPQSIALIKSAGDLSMQFMDIDDITEETEQKKRVVLCLQRSKECLKLLQEIQVQNKNLLNEKVDLTIEAANILKTFEGIVN